MSRRSHIVRLFVKNTILGPTPIVNFKNCHGRAREKDTEGTVGGLGMDDMTWFVVVLHVEDMDIALMSCAVTKFDDRKTLLLNLDDMS